MKPKTLILTLLLVLTGILIFAGYASSASAPKLVRFEGETMGTAWHVSVVADAKHPVTEESYGQIQAALEEALKEVDFRMSTWKDFTELSRLNANESIDEDVELSPELALVLARALEVSAKTGGAYDVTVGPLVDLWKFGPTKNDAEMPEIPDAEAIAAAKAQIGWEALTILGDVPNQTLRRAKPGLRIDLSSIAKGYGVDCAARALETLGVENYMVEVGGEVRTRGRNHLTKPWRIGIQLPIPDSNQLFGSVELTGRSMATSGDYRNFKLEGEKRRSHIIDPRTGAPVEHALVSVSVLADDCMTADAWATALMVLGPVEGKKIAEAEKLPVLFLIQDGQNIREESVGFEFKKNPYMKNP
ncbi:MAG: FAD:protein FMN transferase [Thermoguttaceae bacterium]|nr:FAD:protein FMN transferase [Thermoguttaceae bacterium]